MPSLPREEELRRRRIKRGFSIGEAAEALGVPVTTLRLWIDRGDVPGVQLTPGKHRWITREGLIAFAKKRGIGKFSAERRREPRARVRDAWMTVGVHCPRTNRLLGTGQGKLQDISERGFCVDGLQWKSPLLPAIGTRFSFRVHRHQGFLKGIRGSARLAWLMENRKARGGLLGARNVKFEKEIGRGLWEGQVHKSAWN